MYKGIVVKANHDKHMYIVTYEDAVQYRTGQFSVGDMSDAEGNQSAGVVLHKVLVTTG